MATHSSVIAWKILWTEEPGRLFSSWVHNSQSRLSTHARTHTRKMAISDGSLLFSVTQSCPTLCDPMDCSMLGIPVPHHLLKLAQVQVHCIGDAIQSSHPLKRSSPSALDLSQHQELFQWVSCLHQMTKILEFQLQHKSFQWWLLITNNSNYSYKAGCWPKLFKHTNSPIYKGLPTFQWTPG